jgi:hypothetical protein
MLKAFAKFWPGRGRCRPAEPYRRELAFRWYRYVPLRRNFSLFAFPPGTTEMARISSANFV